MSSSAEPSPRRLAERLFPVPEAHRKAALAWLDREGSLGVAPRRAAAVVVVRDGERGVEVLMLHRPGSPSLGRLSFPGGVTEGIDETPVMWAGPRPTEWARKLGSEDIGLSRRTVVAAARRALVETGLVFAGPQGGGVTENVDGADWMLFRGQLAMLEASLGEVLANRRFVFRTDLLRPLARWMTSDFVHQRVDLHFFAAVLPVGQRATPLASSEDTWLEWVDAATLLTDPAATPVPELLPDARDASGSFVLGEVATPGVQYILELIAASSSAIGFLAARRDMNARTPALDVRDGLPVLRIVL